jgi:hypothetical protein
VVGISALSLGFGVAFAIGIDFARKELTSELPLNKISIGEKGKAVETVAARVLRTGERGVLYFDPKSAQFSLVPWEDIKRVDGQEALWSRTCDVPSLYVALFCANAGAVSASTSSPSFSS